MYFNYMYTPIANLNFFNAFFTNKSFLLIYINIRIPSATDKKAFLIF